MSAFEADRKLVPVSLVLAARSVVERASDPAEAISVLADVLKEVEACPPPILAVVVWRGRVQSLVSDRPDVLAPMLYEALVIDLDGGDGPLVDDFTGRAIGATVTSEPIRKSDFDLASLVVDYYESVEDKKGR